MQLIELEPQRLEHRQAVAEIWNGACGPELAISERAVTFSLQGGPGLTHAGWLAMEDNWAQGMVIASHLAGYPQAAPAHHGWIDALGVMPAVQRQGIGGALLAAAETWLAGQGVTQFVLGGNLRPFAAGLPVETGAEAFFLGRGYVDAPHELPGPALVYDLGADLSNDSGPAQPRELAGAVRPAQRGQENLLLDFLHREFPGRWHYEAELLLHHDRGRISDYMLLWTATGVEGFCCLTFPDSAQPIERYFPYSLPRPWGQIGSVGVSASKRRQGFGSALLDAGLRRLRDNGINGCVVDWTNRLEFYAGFGFAPLRTYRMLHKAAG